MRTITELKSSALFLALIFWTLCGFFFGIQTYLISYHIYGQMLPWSRAIAWSLTYWYVWAFLSLYILKLSKRFSPDRRSLPAWILTHIATSALFSFLHLSLLIIINQVARIAMGTPFSFARKFQSIFAMHFHWDVAIYWMILGFSLLLGYYKKSQERAIKFSQLEAQLARTHLQALKTQLHPHFLFNTLNAISSLMYTNTEAADSMMSRLSDLLRHSMKDSGEQEVLLKDELDFLAKYLEIEQIRFGDRLEVKIDAPSDTLYAMVPNFVLQPLVENAILHGMATLESHGVIEISAHRDNGNLCLRVCDNGRGLSLPTDNTLKEGIGLSNTRKRLRHLYGSRHSLKITNYGHGGTLVSLSFPYYSGIK